MFAKTAIVDYLLQFADQGKQTFSPFLFLANKRKFAVSIFRLQKANESCRFPFEEFWKHGDEDMETWRHLNLP
jgi:hypothetical protein